MPTNTPASPISQQPYTGRFAPSPSGPLHFGSLVAALGSYLRARSMCGRWLVRIEDIDPPREIPGAADDILRTLEAFGLHWDGDVLYQSHRLDAYQQQVDELLQRQDAYYCHCSRKQIQAMGGVYDGRCAKLRLGRGAVRLKNRAAVTQFTDQLMGEVSVPLTFAAEDFIIKRSDGLFAYQLAVVMDDADSGITEVVRGCDLIEASCRQLGLYAQFGLPAPDYLHLPLACTAIGFKLSKQNQAPAVDKHNPLPALRAALAFLGQPAPGGDCVADVLSQALDNFDVNAIPRQREILLCP